MMGAIYLQPITVFRVQGSEVSPFQISVVAAAAPFFQNKRRDEYVKKMKEHIICVLRICAKNGHTRIVLGAWGCGVMRAPPAEVARLFKQCLLEEFASCFEKVCFAILHADHASIFRSEFASEP